MSEFFEGQKIICRDDFDTFRQLKAGCEYEIERVREGMLVLRGVSICLPEHLRGYYATRFDPISTQEG